MRMTDYPAITKFTDDQIMIVDGDGGTKKITIADAILAALHMTSPTNHRMVFRGKNLGTVVTTEQLAAIQAGTFDGLWLGDYWVINGTTWRIADFDYWYNKGDTKCTKHHVVIVPDAPLYNASMNSTVAATGGYVGSEMYTANLANAKSMVSAAFGDSVVSHREYFVNAISSGKPSAATWCDSTVDLMNECMLYGHVYMGGLSNGSAIFSTATTDVTQLALFNVKPELIAIPSIGTWLRDVTSNSGFAVANSDGRAAFSDATAELGVRPAFAIG